MKASTGYRPDIDGLRAIAVLAVVLFHLGLNRFGGGYVGVDVFFVISGFLITGMIKSDIEIGRFDLWRFYCRRGRRLLPALFVTIAISAVVAFLLLSPELLRNFARSAIAAWLAVSNILFWLEADYFDVSARLKPLLHTWTLSVEWQFYAIWPVVLLAGSKFRRTPWIIGLCAGISLALSFLPLDHAALFYLTPFRVFEFCIGALLHWVPRPRGKWSELVVTGGLVMICASVLTFPGIAPPWWLLLPTLGAALVIGGGHAPLAGFLLSNRCSAYAGRLSYSLYLVHWPLITFSEYFFFRALSAGETGIVFLASVGIAVLLHEFVERPIHERKVLRGRGVPLNAAASLVMLLCLTAPAKDGLPWRLDQNARGIRSQNGETKVAKDILGHLGCDGRCSFGNPDGPHVLLIGDSHMDQYTKALKAAAGDRYYFDLIQAPSCFAGATIRSFNELSVSNQRLCDAAADELKSTLPRLSRYAAIVVTERWPAYVNATGLRREGKPARFPDVTSAIDAMMQDMTAQFDGFTGPVVFAGYAPDTKLDCYQRPAYISMRCPAQTGNGQAGYDATRRAFATFSKNSPLSVHFIDTGRIICPDLCLTHDAEGRVLYTDQHHLSVYESALVVQRVLERLPSSPRGPLK